MYEQTIVLLGETTDFTVVCQTCAARLEAGESPAIHGTLRNGDDLGWAECPNGHRVRAIRAGRGVHAELTTPLW